METICNTITAAAIVVSVVYGSDARTGAIGAICPEPELCMMRDVYEIEIDNKQLVS